MTGDEIKARLSRACPTIADRLVASMQRAVRLNLVDCAGAEPARATSRFGGAPDVPAGFCWPTWAAWRGGGPLNFLCQINLAEVAALGIDLGLPGAGLLSFFYDTDKYPGGFDAGDESARRVFWFPDTAALVEAPNPFRAEFPLARKRIVPALCWSLPELEGAGPEPLELADAEWEAYFDLRYDAPGGHPHHQLLGWALPVQGPIEDEAVQFSRGVWASGQFDRKRWEEVEHEAADWRLLLQIDSDAGAQTQWGDMGCIYFAIRHADLAARNFDNVRVIFQCH